MDLEEFIKNTLVSVKKGIASANKELSKIDGAGAFTLVPYKDKEHGVISFDVAVVVSKEAKKSGKGEFRIAILGAQGKKSDLDSEEKVSRIKFNIIPSDK